MTPEEEISLTDPAQVLAAGRALNQALDLDEALDTMIAQARHLTGAQAGLIYLLKSDGLHLGRWQSQGLAAANSGGEHAYLNLDLPLDKSTLPGRAALHRKPLLVPAPGEAPDQRRLDLELNPDHTLTRIWSRLLLPLTPQGGVDVGVLELINPVRDDGGETVFTGDQARFLQSLAPFAATAILRARLLRDSVLRAVAQARANDPWESPRHAQRVGGYAAEIYHRWAVGQGLDTQRIPRGKGLIRLAAMSHDLGKAAVSGQSLRKPGKLTPEEFAEIKAHTIHGARLFDPTGPELDRLSFQVALGHHERFDGTGYPGPVPDLHAEPGEYQPGLSGAQIPLAARVVALADVYDALISQRAYKDPWPEDKVLKTIRDQSGRHFDPELVEGFMDIYPVIQAVRERFPDEKTVVK